METKMLGDKNVHSGSLLYFLVVGE